MVTTIKLQKMYVYPVEPIIALAILLGVLLFVFLLILFMKKVKNKPAANNAPVNATVKTNIGDSLKQKYIGEITRLGEKIEDGSMDERECYQKLSLLIREFVHDATGINTASCTYEDIRGLKIKTLTELIGEFYEPEFARVDELKTNHTKKRDLEKAMAKTRKMIEQWK